MSGRPDFIVVRETGTHFDGLWLERPWPTATGLHLCGGPMVCPTRGLEVDGEGTVAEVWEPTGGSKRLKGLLFKAETTYGTRPSAEPPVGQTLMGRPIVEAPPGTFPPGTDGDIICGPPEDIGKAK